jgi:Leucine-rich repeat (LRR) protein
VLYLNDNQLITLPAEIGQLPKWLKVFLNGNPLENISNEIVIRHG